MACTATSRAALLLRPHVATCCAWLLARSKWQVAQSVEDGRSLWGQQQIQKAKTGCSSARSGHRGLSLLSTLPGDADTRVRRGSGMLWSQPDPLLPASSSTQASVREPGEDGRSVVVRPELITDSRARNRNLASSTSLPPLGLQPSATPAGVHHRPYRPYIPQRVY